MFDVIVEQTDLNFSIKYIYPVFMELASLKNVATQNGGGTAAKNNKNLKRKKGNRLLVSFAKQIGEAGFDKEPAVLKQILAICHDNNYKIRLEGAMFFKDYLSGKGEQSGLPPHIVSHPRFKSVYVSEIFEFLNDDEA